MVEVSDTGPGVPAEDQPRIWTRLYRGDKSRSQRGLGLGLSLVKKSFNQDDPDTLHYFWANYDGHEVAPASDMIATTQLVPPRSSWST